MKFSESIGLNPEKIAELRKLVSLGEGQHLEFKRKAAFPEKIVRELIAFANTEGGTLLIGVADDLSIPGVKFPEEESLLVRSAIIKYCRPGLTFEETIIPISGKKFVVQWHIPKSSGRPHYLVMDGIRSAFVRQGDQSIKATREMCEIIRRKKSDRGGRFTYGDAEQKIIHYLDGPKPLNLRDCSRLIGMNRFITSRKMISLVLANVLKITPSEKGDLFSRA